MTTTRNVYVTAGGYESRCSRPGALGWLATMESLARYRGLDITESDRAYARQIMRCADGESQCDNCARTQAERAWRAVMDAVPAGPCTYCGVPDATTADHVRARALGGAHELSNLVRACRYCNSSKGKLALREWLETSRPQALLARLHRTVPPGQLALDLHEVRTLKAS